MSLLFVDLKKNRAGRKTNFNYIKFKIKYLKTFRVNLIKYFIAIEIAVITRYYVSNWKRREALQFDKRLISLSINWINFNLLFIFFLELGWKKSYTERKKIDWIRYF